VSEAPAVPLAAGEPRPATGELAPAAGPVADQSGVTFHFEDPAGAYVAVCVLQEVTHPRCGPDLEQVRPG
jgi:hypothetical protein